MVDPKKALRRATDMWMQAKRDRETAISRAEREDAEKRIEYWDRLIKKLSLMQEQKTFGQLRELLEQHSVRPTKTFRAMVQDSITGQYFTPVFIKASSPDDARSKVHKMYTEHAVCHHIEQFD